MPIFDICCDACGEIFEYLQITSQDVPICPKCQSCSIHKIFSTFHYRADSDTVKRSLPDPQVPLRELIGKNKPNCEGGYKELENDRRELKDYIRTKDKNGNNIWLPKERKYFDMGKKA